MSANRDKAMLILTAYLKSEGIDFVTELKFHPTRRWRFDLAIPHHKIAIEYEGIFAGKSRHTSLKGYTGDCEKYNAANKLGWRVMRYTALNCGDMIEDVNQLLNKSV